MNNIILTTPEELRVIIREVVSEILPQNDSSKSQIDSITLTGALELLKEYGYPTSKAKMYKLTSSNEIPCKTYGNKLVFSRKEILQWAEKQSKPKTNQAEILMSIAKSARRKK